MSCARAQASHRHRHMSLPSRVKGKGRIYEEGRRV